MKKVGIISELNNKSFNYGNKLQAYALNNYINNMNNDIVAESLIFLKPSKKKNTIFNPLINMKRIFSKIFKVIYNRNKKNSQTNREYSFENRLHNSTNFMEKNIILPESKYNWNKLINSNFDYFIVGSDVVWAQNRYVINRIKFLDFKNKNRNLRKISYAASFGQDYIPRENIKYVKKYLKNFDEISVREKSSIEMLNKIGIKKVIHVCDPTLLLDKEAWKKIEKKPNIVNEEYIFVYLLGKDEQQRIDIKNFAQLNKLKIVMIPHADGVYNQVDENFGDYIIDDCSPENWIWLIENAKYIISDSFHATVFSIIFNKKFFILKRHYLADINNRMYDFLKNINELDKFIDSEELKSINKYTWDYEKINQIISKFQKESIDFLKNALNS